MKTVSSHFSEVPHTKLGWWSVGLAIVFTLMFISSLTGFMQFPGMFTVMLGVLGGFLTLGALIGKGERSWLIWLVLLPGLFAIFITLRSILVPH